MLPSVSSAAISESLWLMGFEVIVLGVAGGHHAMRVKFVSDSHDSSQFKMRVPSWSNGIILRAYCFRSKRQRSVLA